MENKELRHEYGEEKNTRKGHFLGDKYYQQYNNFLGIVIPCILFGTGVAWLVQMIQEPDRYWYMHIGNWIGRAIGGIVVCCILLAVGFVILERLNIAVTIPLIGWNYRDTEESQRRGFKRKEALGSILFGGFFTAVFLLVPEVFCGIFKGGEEIIPVFNSQFIQVTNWMIIAIWAVGLPRDVCKLIYGRYNLPVLVMTIISNSGAGLLTMIWLRSGQLINSQLVEKVLEVFGREELLVYMVTHSQQLLLAIICFGLVVDTINVIAKTIWSARA